MLQASSSPADAGGHLKLGDAERQKLLDAAQAFVTGFNASSQSYSWNKSDEEYFHQLFEQGDLDSASASVAMICVVMP